MLGRHLVLEGAALDGGEQAVDVLDEQVGGAGELHREAGVEHVGGGHALMDEARVRADEFGQMGQEGDDVMLGDALDLVDAVDVEGDVPGLLPDVLRAFLRDHADLGEGVAGVGLDLEPDLEPRLRLPDGDHFGAGIAGDHRRLSVLANWKAWRKSFSPGGRRRREAPAEGAAVRWPRPAPSGRRGGWRRYSSCNARGRP